MKRIKIRLKEFTNPEFLSPETMKTIFGGYDCPAGKRCEIYVDGEEYRGWCSESLGASSCLCEAGGFTGPEVECQAV